MVRTLRSGRIRRARPSAADASTARAGSDATRDEPGCGEPFYLNFVRFEDGEEVSRQPESEYVKLAEGMAPSGPQGPNGPGFSR